MLGTHLARVIFTSEGVRDAGSTCNEDERPLSYLQRRNGTGRGPGVSLTRVDVTDPGRRVTRVEGVSHKDRRDKRDEEGKHEVELVQSEEEFRRQEGKR